MSTSPLSEVIETWWTAVHDLTSLLERLSPEDWSRPTELPGWDVFAVAAHTGHLETLRSGNEHDDVEIGDAPHARGMMGQFTEQGVVARRDRTPDELINEIRACSTAVHTELLADPPDPDAPAPGVFGAIGWSNATLLRNRPLDVWMHEQDIRRAVGDPGNLDSAAARHSSAYLAESLGFVLAKRVKAPAGTTAVLAVEGQEPVAALVGEDGRGQLVDPPASPDVRIELGREEFVLLAGGRRGLSEEPRIDGDVELGRRILDSFAVTP